MEVVVTTVVEQKVFNVAVSTGGGGGGGQGPRGYNGWSPLIRTIQDGERRVQEVYDWTGGQSVKPAITGYIGATGIVQDIALATDVRGDKGQDGEQGIPGIQGEQGIQGIQGIQGERGETGANGSDGADGESAYQIWLDNGNTGSEQDFLDSLVGPAGTTDYNDLQNTPTLGTAAEADASDFATSSQGALADTAVQPAGLPTWATISGKPAFVAEGASASAARTSLGLGTAATTAASAYATAAQGALANTAVQPAAIANMVESEQEGGVGTLIKNIVAMTQAQYDGITPESDTFYIITD